jgi:hypothetical protein
VLFEYSAASIEGGFTRPQIHHYVLDEGGLKRVDPVGLGPRDFVAFWLTHPWPEVTGWTAEGNRVVLERWLKEHQGPFGEFGFPTQHCEQQPDLWQVKTEEGETGEKDVYFLVRWRPPFHFTMVDARDNGSPGCTEIDKEADEPRSLFPVH